MHVVESQELLGQLGTHSKMNAHPAFVNGLHEEGRMRAEMWLDRHFDKLGVRSSSSLAQMIG
jgi:NTE family protein